MPKEYIRDHRSPKPKSETVSRVMSANKAKHSKPEVTLRKALWRAGFRGFRLHYKRVPGRPDISFVSKKLAIFVNGCFWHRCVKCNYQLPKNNTKFWKDKFNRNTLRDEKKLEQLTRLGWQTLVVWECEIKESVDGVVAQIAKNSNPH